MKFWTIFEFIYLIVFGPPTPLAIESGYGQSDQEISPDTHILQTHVSSLWIRGPIWLCVVH